MNYDAIIVGGGLAGASLALGLASAGHRILVLERKSEFKDRVRGEAMLPWGADAARSMGVHAALEAAGACQSRWWNTYVGGAQFAKRDLAATTPFRAGCYHFYHPAMQEQVLSAAARAGAEVRRGMGADRVIPGSPPRVLLGNGHAGATLAARLVVGADGRTSKVRRWAGFEEQRDPEMLMIAGTLLEGTPVPGDGIHMAVGPQGMVLIAPLGAGRARAYFIYPKATGGRGLSGARKTHDFLAACRATGAEASWFEDVQIAGPLAEFDGADTWVDHPARQGVVLIGDAAATSDPCFGAGLSMTMLDVRHLLDCLAGNGDWLAAADEYARRHDEAYSALHQIERWYMELMWTPGMAADERRGRVLPRLMTDPAGLPDLIGLGPASPIDDAARRALLEH